MVNFNTDGTITATNEKDEKFVNEVNKVINILKKEIQPLVEYISNNFLLLTSNFFTTLLLYSILGISPTQYLKLGYVLK